MLLAVSLPARQAAPRTEYYRSEETFRQGIKLFPFEIHEADYLKVVYDDQDFVRLMSWHTREDSLIMTRSYEYWEDDGSVSGLLGKNEVKGKINGGGPELYLRSSGGPVRILSK